MPFPGQNRWLAGCVLVTLALMLITGFFSASSVVSAAGGVVNAVLFYSPSCGHCEQVITQDLPPLLEQYGDQLQIASINVDEPAGQQLYRAAVERFQIPEERLGVPCLVAGETVLVGSLEIPEQFPAIIEKGLQAGGLSWPDIPGLAEHLPEESIQPAAQPLSVVERFQRDLAGNSLSVIVLLGMLANAGIMGLRVFTAKPAPGRWPAWTTPVLAAIGLVIALYLSYVELTNTQAICGPLGNCNTVQQSEYASLFGILPLGVMGAAGYIAILAAWLAGRYGPLAWRNPAVRVAWALVWFGLFFSIYLTFLEPFVIGASCIWCLSSAVIMTLLLWSTNPGVLADPHPARAGV